MAYPEPRGAVPDAAASEAPALAEDEPYTPVWALEESRRILAQYDSGRISARDAWSQVRLLPSLREQFPYEDASARREWQPYLWTEQDLAAVLDRWSQVRLLPSLREQFASAPRESQRYLWTERVLAAVRDAWSQVRLLPSLREQFASARREWQRYLWTEQVLAAVRALFPTSFVLRPRHIVFSVALLATGSGLAIMYLEQSEPFFLDSTSEPFLLDSTSVQLFSNFTFPGILTTRGVVWRDVGAFIALLLRKRTCVQKQGAEKSHTTPAWTHEFGFEVPFRISDIYKRCKLGQLHRSEALVGMEPFYYFNLGRHHAVSTERVVAPPWIHKCLASDIYPPYKRFLEAAGSGVLDRRFIIVQNKYHKEFERKPYNYYTASELDQLFLWLSRSYPEHVLLYWGEESDAHLRKMEPAISNTAVEQVISKHGNRVLTLHQVIGPLLETNAQNVFTDLPNRTLQNSLCMLILSRTDLAFAVQGGLQHVFAYFVPEIYVLHIEGFELSSGEYACHSRFQHPQLARLRILTSRSDVPKLINGTCNESDRCPRGGLQHLPFDCRVLKCS